jgi:hypothetical protein
MQSINKVLNTIVKWNSKEDHVNDLIEYLRALFLQCKNTGIRSLTNGQLRQIPTLMNTAFLRTESILHRVLLTGLLQLLVSVLNMEDNCLRKEEHVFADRILGLVVSGLYRHPSIGCTQRKAATVLTYLLAQPLASIIGPPNFTLNAVLKSSRTFCRTVPSAKLQLKLQTAGDFSIDLTDLLLSLVETISNSSLECLSIGTFSDVLEFIKTNTLTKTHFNKIAGLICKRLNNVRLSSQKQKTFNSLRSILENKSMTDKGTKKRLEGVFEDGVEDVVDRHSSKMSLWR